MYVALGPRALFEGCANVPFRQNQKDEIVSSHISLPSVACCRDWSEKQHTRASDHSPERGRVLHLISFLAVDVNGSNLFRHTFFLFTGVYVTL